MNGIAINAIQGEFDRQLMSNSNLSHNNANTSEGHSLESEINTRRNIIQINQIIVQNCRFLISKEITGKVPTIPNATVVCIFPLTIKHLLYFYLILESLGDYYRFNLDLCMT